VVRVDVTVHEPRPVKGAYRAIEIASLFVIQALASLKRHAARRFEPKRSVVAIDAEHALEGRMIHVCKGSRSREECVIQRQSDDCPSDPCVTLAAFVVERNPRRVDTRALRANLGGWRCRRFRRVRPRKRREDATGNERVRGAVPIARRQERTAESWFLPRSPWAALSSSLGGPSSAGVSPVSILSKSAPTP
jgi:hypothetical protein